MNLITTFDKMKGLCCIYDAMYCLSGLVKSAVCTTVIKTHKKPPRKNFQGCRIQTVILLIKQRNAVLYEYLCILLFFTGTFFAGNESKSTSALFEVVENRSAVTLSYFRFYSNPMSRPNNARIVPNVDFVEWTKPMKIFS